MRLGVRTGQLAEDSGLIWALAAGRGHPLPGQGQQQEGTELVSETAAGWGWQGTPKQEDIPRSHSAPPRNIEPTNVQGKKIREEASSC